MVLHLPFDRVLSEGPLILPFSSGMSSKNIRRVREHKVLLVFREKILGPIHTKFGNGYTYVCSVFPWYCLGKGNPLLVSTLGSLGILMIQTNPESVNITPYRVKGGGVNR